MSYVAYTPEEGRWPFTVADTPEQTQRNLVNAICERRVLSIPINNPISAVSMNEYDRAYLKKRGRQ